MLKLTKQPLRDTKSSRLSSLFGWTMSLDVSWILLITQLNGDDELFIIGCLPNSPGMFWLLKALKSPGSATSKEFCSVRERSFVSIFFPAQRWSRSSRNHQVRAANLALTENSHQVCYTWWREHQQKRTIESSNLVENIVVTDKQTNVATVGCRLR